MRSKAALGFWYPIMARCDEGYLCAVCGEEVKRLIDSSLYLQFVIGWITIDQLQTTPDVHLRCNPGLAQFIETPEFSPPVVCSGEFDRKHLDPTFSTHRTRVVTEGYLRLRELQRNRNLPIEQYPLKSESQ